MSLLADVVALSSSSALVTNGLGLDPSVSSLELLDLIVYLILNFPIQLFKCPISKFSILIISYIHTDQFSEVFLYRASTI